MSTSSVAIPQDDLRLAASIARRVGMYCLIAAEAAIFTIFVVAYIFYIGKSLTGPQPKDVLHVADLLHDLSAFEQPDDSRRRRKLLRRGNVRRFRAVVAADHCSWEALSLSGTAREWHHLIYDEGLTIRRICSARPTTRWSACMRFT